MQQIETEVKFKLDNPSDLSRKLTALATPKTDRRLETNLRLDDRSESLRQRAALLRLRRDDRITLTYKTPLATTNLQAKSRQESEVEVSDFGTLRHILADLGFNTVQTYEKYRQEWELADSILCLDEMPFGTFLEIEGPLPSLPIQALALEMNWSRRILTNYLTIFAGIKEEFKLSFDDVTFAIFEPLELPEKRLNKVIAQFEMGTA